MAIFKIESNFIPSGDQPKAVEKLVNGIKNGLNRQTLLGVTGSGKTYSMACVIESINCPTLVIAHNKTLAAQLATEFKEFFPNNAVEYFVSYYDYYQPEAYMPKTDVYIEKDSSINDKLDELRLSATRSLASRKDVLIVASVSCVFNLGSPIDYQNIVCLVKKDQNLGRNSFIRQLINMHYERNDFDFSRGKFRVRGDTIDLLPAYEKEVGFRVEFWGDIVEKVLKFDPLTGEIITEEDEISIYPARHFVTDPDNLDKAINGIESELEGQLKNFKKSGKILEASRLESRTRYDIEMLRQTGFCSGVENYSMHLSDREPGSTPFSLLHYFPNDYLMFVDESHMTLPQLRGMYFADRSRKEVLVEHGFRLPSALDNRPLNFDEFNDQIEKVIYVSATPAKYEYEKSDQIVEQVIRPTGLLDPKVEVKPIQGQIDDLLFEIKNRSNRNERCLVTTLTKRMAEELSQYLSEAGVKTHYLHSEIKTLQRSEILSDLRLGTYDVVVGINLLREGLDLPEVSLVAILDADKEGFLRSETSLIQTIGRAARHVEGKVIMYADQITSSMLNAINETDRRRDIQEKYNLQNGIEPKSIFKSVHDITERISGDLDTTDKLDKILKENPDVSLNSIIIDLKAKMHEAAEELKFEEAALIRDQIKELKIMAKMDMDID
ncbi:MAG: excinuclease ABC subunit UvrB [SAR202 cluster bacterium]|nr:excinuclease ABC subunit UvrB [SAR202 cluster bacterium]|tara:strand:+ start:32825 stop:34819 length:1995 start_codon:yes stop_codon:yes gene_type:complete